MRHYRAFSITYQGARRVNSHISHAVQRPTALLLGSFRHFGKHHAQIFMIIRLILGHFALYHARLGDLNL